MGKALILLVLSAGLSGSMLIAQQHNNAVERASRSRDASLERLAEDVARSAYAMGAQRLSRDYAPFTQSGVPYGDGRYDLQAHATGSGRFALHATADVGGAQYSVRGDYARLESPCQLLGAVFLHTTPAVSSLALSGSGFRIRGEDTQPPSRTGGSAELDGPGYTVAGILADTLVSESFTLPLGEIATLEAGITVGGVADQGYLRSLTGCLLRTLGSALDDPTTLLSGDQFFYDHDFGSPGAPEVVVIEGDVEFTGTARGYGLLVVGGDVRFSGEAAWEGLVMAFGDGLATVSLEDDARIHGALVGGGLPHALPSLLDGLVGLPLFGESTVTGLLSGHLDEAGALVGELGLFRRPLLLSMSGDSGVYYSEEALASVSAALPTGASHARTALMNERYGIAAAP